MPHVGNLKATPIFEESKAARPFRRAESGPPRHRVTVLSSDLSVLASTDYGFVGFTETRRERSGGSSLPKLPHTPF